MIELTPAVEIAERVQPEGRTPSNHSDFVDRVLSEVADLSNEGELAAASARIDDGLAREEAESRARTLRLLLSGVEQALLARDAVTAATRLIRMADLEADGAGEFESLQSLRSEWYERGRDRGINLDLEVSIALAERILLRASDTDQRAIARNDLGNALAALGERAPGTARLEEAVAAYRAALEDWTRDRVPLNWAGTQNNLGTALWALGEREAGTAWLEEAVAAYRAALEERTRDRVPFDWANTAGNQAEALQALADRTDDLEMARRALAQLTEAARLLREGGHLPRAEGFEGMIPDAEALVARLSG